MDWVEDMETNLWVFPRGMKRDGGLGKGSLEWTSKYGSVVASVYEGGSADGMNEKGLAANLHYQDTQSPGALWVKLDQMDFNDGAGVRKLTLAGKPDTVGDQSGNFKQCDPFKFLAPATH